jgi:hypothetical protein
MVAEAAEFIRILAEDLEAQAVVPVENKVEVV